MQNIKVGDLVKFYKKRKIKTGEVVAVKENGTADVFEMSESKVYNLPIEKLIKI